MVAEEVIVKGLSLKIDRFLKAKLDLALSMQKNDFDIMFLIDGQEGSGKSTLAFICAWYLSNGEFTINHISEGSADAVDKLEKLPDESVMIVDEGSLLFSSRDTMKDEQKRLVKILNVIRQKKMILIIVAPSLFDLNKYIAVSRSRFLLHVYVDKRTMQRGRFLYFSEKKKRILYELGKKTFNSYLKPKSNFKSVFQKFLLPFHKEYIELKKRTLFSALRDKKDNEGLVSPRIKKILFRDTAKRLRERFPDLKQYEVGELLGVDRSAISEYLLGFKPNSSLKPTISS